jgi:HEPN domain-containing protein
MATRSHLRKIARARLRDAEVLLEGRRFDGALYVCGYAIETILKARICTTLRWNEYFVSRDYTSFRTHDLAVLLNMTGRTARIKALHLADWSTVPQWNPERRYDPIGTVDKKEAEAMISSTKKLLAVL